MPLTPGDLMRTLSEGNIDPVYLFQGNDPFLQKYLVEKISNAHFQEGQHDLTSLLPDEMNGQEIVSRLTSMDLFSEKKLFILRKPSQVHAKWQKALLHYCENPVPGHILVVIDEETGTKKSIVKKLEKTTKSVSVRPPFESEMKKWAVFFLKSHALKATGSVVNTIIEIAGDSLHHMYNEIEKVALIHDGETELKNEDIRQFSGWKRERWRWEFLIAIGNRNIDEALHYGSSLIMQNDTLLQLVYPLTSLFTEIYLTKLNQGTTRSRGSIIFLTPGVTRRIPQFAQRYMVDECERILSGLVELDERLKSTRIHDDAEFANFIFEFIAKNGR